MGLDRKKVLESDNLWVNNYLIQLYQEALLDPEYLAENADLFGGTIEDAKNRFKKYLQDELKRQELLNLFHHPEEPNHE